MSGSIFFAALTLVWSLRRHIEPLSKRDSTHAVRRPSREAKSTDQPAPFRASKVLTMACSSGLRCGSAS